MAATLIDIKCKMLLPREVNEEGEEQDPREELVQKLLEYKMYKFVALELRDRQVDAAKSWYKSPSLPKEVKDYKAPIDYDELIGDVNLAKLHDIFKSVMKRQVDKIDPIRSGFGKIEKDEINLEEKQLYIEDYVKNHKTFSFRNLLERQGSKMEVIVTFMAILEMMKQGVISVEQEETFSDIIITSALAA
jgi:segregation and condensation protein A